MYSSVSGRQIKAARALIGWSRKDLAQVCGVSAPTVKVVEADVGNTEALAGTRERMRHVLETAGVEFINGGTLGVRLWPKDEGVSTEGLRTDELNASNDD